MWFALGDRCLVFLRRCCKLVAGRVIGVSSGIHSVWDFPCDIWSILLLGAGFAGVSSSVLR